MDGVLIDNEGLKFENWKRITGTDIDEEYFKKKCVGKSREIICDILIKKYDLSYNIKQLAEIEKEGYKKLMQDKRNIVPIDSAVDFLKRVYGKYKVALASSQNIEFINLALDHLKISKYFDNNIFSGHDSVARDKPSPDIYLLVSEKIDSKPELCIVVEDTLTGILSAKAAGMYCIAVPNEFTKYQDFSKADLVLNSLKEVNIESLKWK